MPDLPRRPTSRRIRIERSSGAIYRDTASHLYYGEKFNALTHLAAAVAALAGTVVLVVLAALGGDPWKLVGVSIYGTTLLVLYTFSALYHSVRGRTKDVLRQLDHHGIYLLIAGSYTPFCLVTLRGPWGWSLFGVCGVWRWSAACRTSGRGPAARIAVAWRSTS